MKKLLSILAFSIFGSALFAQISLEETELTMSKGLHTAYVLTFPDVELKTVEKGWKDFMKSYKTKPKRNKKTNEYFSDNAKIEKMSDNVVDVYSKLEKGTDNQTIMTVWYDLGGAYVDSETHPEQAVVAQQMLQDFVFKANKELAEAVVKAEEKELKVLNDDLKKLEKQNANHHDDIRKAEEKIAQLKADIESNLQDQKMKKEEIGGQEEVVKEVKAMRAKFE
ncbi:MAG: hypothetical protein AB8G22_23525 [Saprospiraceae bacterium]